MIKILIIVLIIIWFKGILMTFSLPFIHYYMRIKKRINNISDVSVDGVAASASFKKGVLNNVRRYIAGYIRYFIFQVGTIPSHTIRNLIYRHVLLIDLDPKAVIYFGAEI